MIQEFQTFYYRLLLSLTPDVPLEENLRALVAPALSKLRMYTGAEVAIHSFANPALRELHAMAVGSDEKTRAALQAESAHRHQYDRPGRAHRSNLPAYEPFKFPSDAALDPIFDFEDPVPRELEGQDVLWLLELLASRFPREFGKARPGDHDTVIVTPLGTGEYGRLGSFLLWAPGELLRSATKPRKLKELMAFRKSFEQVMIRIFTNLYGMVPSTYLPSYHQAGARPVALLCAEIREFDRICDILRRRNDLDGAETARCLARLVRRFTRTAADIIEQNQGRVDQTWGSGILGVFGEHLASETPEGASVGCIRALTAASAFVASFSETADDWLQNDFDVDLFRKSQAADIRVEAALLVDFGNVVFDYIGSSRHQSYMTIGDRVDLVKALLTVADRHAAQHAGGGPDRPIILSQAAYHWCQKMLEDVAPDPRPGYVSTPHLLKLPGRLERYPVRYVRPENIKTEVS